MQTLPAGSFLNLENDSTVESLKHTARRLAEHSANVVKENLPPAALENLANSLWQKAEYVARETERRRLHQIFVENFSERFRELKPETAEAQKSEPNGSPAEATVETVESVEQAPAPLVAERSEGDVQRANEIVPSPILSEESATVAEGKRDEFLGFVESGEPFGDGQATDARAEADDQIAAEPSKPENQSSIETTSSANQPADAADQSASPTPENSIVAKTEATVSASAESKTATTAMASAGKNGAADGREPFEFERCTIILNLTLLPAEIGKTARKLIVGTASHNLPPEIEFLEIGDGADLTQIAAVVSDKLARFKQTLPVKYIEQLRASKAKSAKKNPPTKATTTAATAAPTHQSVNQANAEKQSGEHKVPEAKTVETAKPQSDAMAAETSSTKTSTAPMPIVNQSGAGNSIQGSLF